MTTEKTHRIRVAPDGRRYAQYADGVLLGLEPSWNLPSRIEIGLGGSVGVRQYAVNAAGRTLTVEGLPLGLEYNPVTERIVSDGTPPPYWNVPDNQVTVITGTPLPIRQFAVLADGRSLSVKNLPPGVTYNALLEQLEAVIV